jgi:hypothetical protein
MSSNGRSGRGKTVLTREVMESVVPALIKEGLSREEMAKRLGCAIGSLQVQCSNYGLSLPKKGHRGAGKTESVRVTISKKAFDVLMQRAWARTESEAELASKLLELVLVEDMINAVLDEDEPREEQAA